jgi:hypothetical protein
MAARTNKAHEDNDMPELNPSKAKIIRRGPRHPLGPRMSLRTMREGSHKTQAEIAAAAEMTQGDVSRLESRLEDEGGARISTLRRYVEALGGELDLVVSFKSGHRMRIAL